MFIDCIGMFANYRGLQNRVIKIELDNKVLNILVEALIS
jgi:hypothetical protein